MLRRSLLTANPGVILVIVFAIFLAPSIVYAMPNLPPTPPRHAPAAMAEPLIARDSTVASNRGTFTPNPDFVITSKPTTRTYHFTVGTAIGAPDGYEREMMVINGQFPTPLIEVNEGDTIVVNVHNTMSIGTSFHWHGMYQNGTDWADGVPGITQCPIPAHSSFTYRFTVTGQYGTYWYHAHTSNNLADGLVGPLVIHSPSDPYLQGRDYDYEEIIMLGDWMHDQSDTIVAALLSPEGYRGTIATPVPDSLLVNGIGVYNCSNTTEPCKTRTIPDVLVVPNKKYRFRVINHSSHAHYKFSVDDHPLNVIAADGTSIVAVPGVHQLPVNIAQRYDVIIDTSVGTDGSAYYIRAAMCAASVANVPSGYDIFALAALRYVAHGSNPTKTPPTSSDWSDSNNNETVCVDFPNSSIVPYEREDAPTGIFDTAILDSSFGSITDASGDSVFRFFWNGVTWTDYIYQPMLFTIRNGGSLNSSIITHHVFTELGGADIVVNNLDTFIDHPYHLHGRYFYIVARGEGRITTSNYPSLTFTTRNPPRRDTLVIPRQSYAVLRLVTDDPGVWPFHCHIGWHLAAGKMAAIVVRPDAIRKQTTPAAALALCDPSNFPPGDTVNTTAPGKKRGSHGRRRGISPPHNLPANMS